MALGPDVVEVNGNSDSSAKHAARWCGPQSLGILREAAVSELRSMSFDDAFAVLSSMLPPASFIQSQPGNRASFGVPGETRVTVSMSALAPSFCHRLLAADVMCS